MKKVLYLLFLFLVPFMVKAEVKITEATLVDHSKYLDADEHPDFNGLNIDFDLKFSAVGEFAKYKLIIKNEDQKDYEVEIGNKTSPDGYVKYEITYSGEDDILKAGAEKEIFVTVSYAKLVAKESFSSGKYEETGTMEIDLSNDDKPVDPEPEPEKEPEPEPKAAEEQEENPKTTIGYYVLGVSIILFISLLIILYSNHKLSNLSVLLIGILLIPIAVYALEKITIVVDANIEIEEYEELNLHICGATIEDNIDVSIPFKPGTTWEEFIESPYYEMLDENNRFYFTLDSNTGNINRDLSYTSQEYINCEKLAEDEFKQGLITQQEKYDRIDICANTYDRYSSPDKEDPIHNISEGSYQYCPR